MVTLFKPMQPLIALQPISVTEFGNDMLVSPVQSLNAKLPITLTDVGMVTFVKVDNLEQIYSGIISTSLPNLNSVILLHSLQGL